MFSRLSCARAHAAAVLFFLVVAGVQLEDVRPKHCDISTTDDDVSLMQNTIAISKSALVASKQAEGGTSPREDSTTMSNRSQPFARHVEKSARYAEPLPAIARSQSINAADFVWQPWVNWNWTRSYPSDLMAVPARGGAQGLNFSFYHPAGVVSNVYDGVVVWADVWYIDLGHLGVLVLFAYPCVVLPVALLGAIAVGMCLSKDEDTAEAPNQGPPAVPTSQLTPMSATIYAVWCFFCRALPSILVFVTPFALILSSFHSPQEVYTVMLLISSVFILANGMYVSLFSPFVLNKMRQNMQLSSSEALQGVRADQKQELVHWVIFPNFSEDEDIIAAAVGSVAKSSLACSSICILLAMEEREGENGRTKSRNVSEQFAGKFREVFSTFHPRDLPNDPAGKASNVAYAFKQLVEHLKDTGQEESKVMLTIADADTEFHELYFEFLTRQHFCTEEPQRSVTIWQSAVLHMKNYHRQPGPVTVGTMFTAMTELSFMADANGVRFPYSSYSLPLQLASAIGGWDPEWIAEDWHLGIKCFFADSWTSRDTACDTTITQLLARSGDLVGNLRSTMATGQAPRTWFL